MRATGLVRVGFLVTLLALWEIAFRMAIWDPLLFPSPAQVAQSLWRSLEDRSLLIATGISLRRIFIGYAIALVGGTSLGVLLARWRFLEVTVGSLVLGLQTLPSICWLPLALLWFGLNDRAILFVVVMGAIMAIVVSVYDGIKNLPPIYEKAALTLGAGRWALNVEVLLPAAFPSILTGAKLGWSFAWRSLMAGELVFVSAGLGHMMMMGRELADMGQVMAVMVVIIGLGLFVDRVVFRPLETSVRRRWGLMGA